MSENPVDLNRRRMLTGASVVLGGIGSAFAAVPFVASFQPSERAKAIGAPVEADISKLEPGQLIRYKWRGAPVWVLRRSADIVEQLEAESGYLSDPGSEDSEQPPYAENPWRSQKPEYLVLVGVCTHLGCSPSFIPEPGAEAVGPDWPGGFFCPCHGSKFDLAGRVFKGVPAPTNLRVPPYKFISDTRILIGEDAGETS